MKIVKTSVSAVSTGTVPSPKFRVLAVLLLLLLLVFVLALALGPADIPYSKTFAHFTSYLGINSSPLSEVESNVVELSRMPRAIMAILVGSALGVGGLIMQSVFRNPLAEPSVLGVSSGAALGATLAISLGFGTAFLLALPLTAFVFATATVLIAMYISQKGGRSLTSLVLVGIALNALISALLTLNLLFLENLSTQRQILFWLAGGFDFATWSEIRVLFFPVIVGLLVVGYYVRDMNTLLLGDDEAYTLGTNVKLVRRVMILCATLLVGAAVAFSGIIAFVGIVIPHILRLIVGHDNRILLPLSIVGGGLFMLSVDVLSRNVALPSQIPVGVITALLGAPFFIAVLLRRRVSYELTN